MARIDHGWAMAVVVLGALLLAGCANDVPVAAPSALPTASGSPTPSPAPASVTVAPARPSAMDDDGPVGAEAAAVYFLSLDSYMQATGDTASWEAMSHETCDYCARRLEQARQVAASGDTFEGGEVTIQIVSRYAQDPTTGIWPMDVDVAESATTITRPDGTVAFEMDSNAYTARVEVARRDDAWVLVELANTTPK